MADAVKEIIESKLDSFENNVIVEEKRNFYLK